MSILIALNYRSLSNSMSYLRITFRTTSCHFIHNYTHHSLIIIIFKSAANHNICARDVKLNMSLSSTECSHNNWHLGIFSFFQLEITCHQFFSLSIFKIEFLLHGMPQQLVQLHHPTISSPSFVTLPSVNSD